MGTSRERREDLPVGRTGDEDRRRQIAGVARGQDKIVEQHGVEGGQARALRTELNAGNAPAIEGVGGLRRHIGGAGYLRLTVPVQRLAQGVKSLRLPGRMCDRRIGQQFRPGKTKLRERVRKAHRETHRPVGPDLRQHVGRRRRESQNPRRPRWPGFPPPQSSPDCCSSR